MSKMIYDFLKQEIEQLHLQGLYKKERVIVTPQQAVIRTNDQREVINLCANNYLGLADHPDLVEAGQKALQEYGYGMASVRFICGTQSPHKKLEHSISDFFNTEDAILYSSCFDANGGLFECLLGEQDAIISDALNHASIIDGIRLSKAKRFRYANNNMDELEQCLQQAQSARFKMIATDGVFSMDGIIANLPRICELAKNYDALVMVDDSHAAGFMGKKGRGTPEYYGLMDKVDILTGTLGKAFGGASGGYTAGKKEVVEWLRQRSRPYLFSNTLAPVVAATSIKVFELLQASDSLREKLMRNSTYFRNALSKAGFTLIPGEHPIIPVMLNDAKIASLMADKLLEEGIYVISFSFPVVPKNRARIRTQMSATHEIEHLDKAIEAFIKVGNSLEVI